MGTDQNHPARCYKQKIQLHNHQSSITFHNHMADNATKALLQHLLTKSDALESKLDEKLTKIENTIRAEINGIKKDLETYKE